MKKVFGIILLVIFGLNAVTILVRLSSGEPIGSPGYVLILFGMLIGGVALINSSKKDEGVE